MKILIVNSDLAKNRGDRAIAEGVIHLVRKRWPNCKITGLSEYASRDSEWFGIDFLPISSQSLNPIDMLRLLKEVRKSDIILWGGGELLKDYTNKASLWYWVVKILLVKACNRNIYGIYQGIGPTHGKLSRRLIILVIRQTRLFIVRDHLSYKKLREWGCPDDKIVEAADPAIMLGKSRLSNSTAQKLLKKANVDESFTNNFVAIGPRDWFHYKKGGILPYKYRKFIKKNKDEETPEHKDYINNLEVMTNHILSLGYNILFIPMHMGEEDIALSQHLMNQAERPEKVRVLDKDIFSPQEIRSIISKARAMIGLRLHSTIIAISTGVPSFTYYYVDKGRAFFEQLGMSEYSEPILGVINLNFKKTFQTRFAKLTKEDQKISSSANKVIADLKKRIVSAFNNIEPSK